MNFMNLFSTLNRYIGKKFLHTLLVVLLVFVCLCVILNLFEEVNFFKDHNVTPAVPLIMTFLKVPILLLSLFPFIVLISSVYLFLNLIQTYELISIKTAGISNIKIIAIPALIAFGLGLFIIFGCTPLTSKITQKYYDVRSNYSSNNNYLAAITANGIWIRENINGNYFSIIEAKKIKDNRLQDIAIYKFDKDYNLVSKIRAESANINSKKWQLINVRIFTETENKNYVEYESFEYESTYNAKELTKFYSNLDTISFWKLKSLIKVYNERGYSIKEIESKIHKSLAFPFYLLSMVLLAAVFIFKINFRSKYSGYIILSIISCIAIYYINDFSNALGKTEKIPVIFSIWMPTLIIYTFSFVGLLRINEK